MSLQDHVWLVWWVLPCPGIVFLGTQSTLHHAWNPLGYVSVEGLGRDGVGFHPHFEGANISGWVYGR